MVVRYHDTQHNDNKNNNTQHDNRKRDMQQNDTGCLMLFMLNVVHAECRVFYCYSGAIVLNVVALIWIKKLFSSWCDYDINKLVIWGLVIEMRDIKREREREERETEKHQDRMTEKEN